MEVIKRTISPIVQGTTGLEAATMLNPVIQSIYGIEQYEITQTDVVDYKVSYDHGNSTFKLLPFLYDKNWRQMATVDLFSVVDELGNASPNHWTLDVNNEIDTVLHLFIIFLK